MISNSPLSPLGLFFAAHGDATPFEATFLREDAAVVGRESMVFPWNSRWVSPRVSLRRLSEDAANTVRFAHGAEIYFGIHEDVQKAVAYYPILGPTLEGGRSALPHPLTRAFLPPIFATLPDLNEVHVRAAENNLERFVNVPVLPQRGARSFFTAARTLGWRTMPLYFVPDWDNQHLPASDFDARILERLALKEATAFSTLPQTAHSQYDRYLERQHLFESLRKKFTIVHFDLIATLAERSTERVAVIGDKTTIQEIGKCVSDAGHELLTVHATEPWNYAREYGDPLEGSDLSALRAASLILVSSFQPHRIALRLADFGLDTDKIVSATLCPHGSEVSL